MLRDVREDIDGLHIARDAEDYDDDAVLIDPEDRRAGHI